MTSDDTIKLPKGRVKFAWELYFSFNGTTKYQP